VLSDFSWSQDLDSSFPQFMGVITSGKAIDKVTVDWVETGSAGAIKDGPYFQMTFDGVFLTSLGLDSGAAGGANSDVVSGSFAYEQITATYTTFNKDGSKTGEESASYNLRTGEGSLAALSQAYAIGSTGAALTVVPVPPAVWLFASAILGVVGFARRRKTGH
jgi:type VI protein secretion system component Hcp